MASPIALSPPLTIAVIGHVEHITLGRAASLPRPGDILHLDNPVHFGGGGGGIAFHQLARSPAQIVLFTAFGNDGAAAFVEAQVRKTSAHVHAARRELPHTRDLVLITPDGERTIVVIGEPLHPAYSDPLEWAALAQCDAAYFTSQDPAVVRAARSARRLVVTARRREALIASGVRADIVVGSAFDPREVSTLADYPVPPEALVLTEGAAGGRIETAAGIVRFEAPKSAPTGGGAYGAGDSFAGALTYFVAAGLPLALACTRAGQYGAAVRVGLNPIEHQLRLDVVDAADRERTAPSP